MGIIKAVVEDCKQISLLLKQLDFQDTEQFLIVKIETLLKDTNEELLVYEEDKKADDIVQYISDSLEWTPSKNPGKKGTQMVKALIIMESLFLMNNLPYH